MSAEKNEIYERRLGSVLDKRYRLDEIIGYGGMAVVYKATDLAVNNQIVAIKMLKEDSACDEIVVKRFKNECRAETMLNHKNIVSEKKEKDCVSLIVGEDIGRFIVSSNKYIQQGMHGINYKSYALYQGPKVLVRKTGVGITAGIDYNNSLTNQVVYIVKPKESVHPSITAEVIVAILCSRLITYIIIKRKGCIGWTSNPYLSQQDVNSLPFPKLNFQCCQTMVALNRITELVRSNLIKGKELSIEVDAEIERYVAFLYNLNNNEYKTIFKTIEQVEQMIPFRRLLNINTDCIFQNGI
jgi:hypothetical protein